MLAIPHLEFSCNWQAVRPRAQSRAREGGAVIEAKHPVPALPRVGLGGASAPWGRCCRGSRCHMGNRRHLRARRVLVQQAMDGKSKSVLQLPPLRMGGSLLAFPLRMRMRSPLSGHKGPQSHRKLTAVSRHWGGYIVDLRLGVGLVPPTRATSFNNPQEGTGLLPIPGASEAAVPKIMYRGAAESHAPK